jgi:hypothetical protein
MRIRTGLTVLLASLMLSAPAWASVPMSVWAKVQKVVYEPQKAGATRIQIHGAFMFYKDIDAGAPLEPFLDYYTAPASGVLYYECPAGQAEICADEWADIEASIAWPTGMCISWGNWDQPVGTLHAPGAALGSPDLYPIHMGTPPGNYGHRPCMSLREFVERKADGGGQAGAAGTTGASGSSGEGGKGGTGAGGSSGEGGKGGTGAGGSSGEGGTGAGGSSGSSASQGGKGGGAGELPGRGGCAIGTSRAPLMLGSLLMLGAALLTWVRRRSAL